MKNVSRAVIYGLAISLPPLAEQRRIMAKVNKLMEVCDQLETQVANVQGETSRLLEAILYHGLNNVVESASPTRLSPQINLVGTLFPRNGWR